MKAIKVTTDNEIRAMLDSSMAVIVLSEELTILQANNNCQHLFSCARELLLGQQVGDIFRIHRAQFPFTSFELAQDTERQKKFTTIFKIHNLPDKTISWDLQLFKTNDLVYLLMANPKPAPKLNLINSAAQTLSQNVIGIVSNASRQPQNIAQFFEATNSIIQALPGYAHLKSNNGFTYQATNQATLKLLGLREASELIGKDDYDLAKLMGWKWPSHFAQELQDYDSSVLVNNAPIIALEEKPYLNSEGDLIINSLTKIPLFVDNIPFGVLTFATDISRLKSIFNIRMLFKQLYLDAAKAHQKFLDYLGLPIVLNINQSLTEKEYDILFAYCRGIPAKVYARDIGLSPRTVEKRLELIKEKFIKFDKNRVIELILLRGHEEILE